MSLGRIEINTEVIVDIIKHTIEDNEEVFAIAEKTSKNEPINILKNITKIGQNKMVDVELGEDECVIDLGVVIFYGLNIEKVVEKLQNDIKENVENITNKRVSEVNVIVKNLKKKEEEVKENV